MGKSHLAEGHPKLILSLCSKEKPHLQGNLAFCKLRIFQICEKQQKYSLSFAMQQKTAKIRTRFLRLHYIIKKYVRIFTRTSRTHKNTSVFFVHTVKHHKIRTYFWPSDCT
jgi:hypothetical protein